MKANEFIKKYGVEAAKGVLHCMDDASEFKTYMPGDTWDKPTLIDAVGLRRLIESHELVEVGLPELKKAMFSNSTDLEYVKNWLLTVSEKLLTEKGIKLKQAILDVESCNVD